MMRTVLWALLGLLAQAALAQTPEVPKWAFAARVEYHVIPSLTLSDEQFLRGDANGPTVQLTGELRLPQGSQAKWPAVVIMHGSGGISPANQNWAQVLNQAGYASLVVDSFTARHMTDVCGRHWPTQPSGSVGSSRKVSRALARAPSAVRPNPVRSRCSWTMKCIPCTSAISARKR